MLLKDIHFGRKATFRNVNMTNHWYQHGQSFWKRSALSEYFLVGQSIQFAHHKKSDGKPETNNAARHQVQYATCGNKAALQQYKTTKSPQTSTFMATHSFICCYYYS